MRQPRLIFLVTEDWYFYMHRLPQARAARDAGFEVCVATRVDAHGARIAAEGFRLIPLQWQRGSLSPFVALKDIFEIAKMYRREKPDIVHHVSLKSILLGTIAARFVDLPLPNGRGREAYASGISEAGEGVRLPATQFSTLTRFSKPQSWLRKTTSPVKGEVNLNHRQVGNPIIVNAFTGLGLLFQGMTLKIKLVRALAMPIMRFAFASRCVYTITENADHRHMLIDKKLITDDRSIVIRGSGIDIDRFTVLPEPPRVPPVIACAARMLHGKGILVLAEAMRILALSSPAKLLLAGTTDPGTPDSLTDAEMARVAAEPNIEWLGRIEDVRDLWARAHIGVLASITGEGLPVSLLEAAACGRAIVATDVPGCREIVVTGTNGILVPPNDAEALAAALETLAHGYDLRVEYGQASRRMVESELSAAEVGKRTVQLYRDLLETK